MIKFFRYLIVIFLFFSANGIFAQTGIPFAEFAQKLEYYFDKALIKDVKTQLPESAEYTIWGWDVGDFSGDGFNDLAFSLRMRSERKRVMQVYMFVVIDGYMTLVGNFPYRFVDLPLETGVVIKDNVCYITQKQKLFNWNIKGYRFDNGVLILYDEFVTKKLNRFTHESYKNYNTLRNSERYIKTKTSEEEFKTEYFTVLSYPRGKQLFKGYSEQAISTEVQFVQKGAYNWKGTDDASFKVKSVHDDEFLYMTVDVVDDVIVTQACDDCPSDYVEMWLDLNEYGEDESRFSYIQRNNVVIRTDAEEGQFSFIVSPGNFYDTKAFITIRSTDNLDTEQKVAAKTAKAVSILKDNGYMLKFKIPFLLLGFDGNPILDTEAVEFGCSVIVHDIDNEFRPEEKSEISTSYFSEMNPSTYGTLLLIPEGEWYGKSYNIYKQNILQTISEYGY